MKCPICEGEGRLVEYSLPELGTAWNPCGACKESGTVSIWWMLRYWFWNTVPVSFIEWYAYRIMSREENDASLGEVQPPAR